ncbi:acetyltransferase (GNAT) family protein [Hydrogenoanaerobacterium saccharovorans]|uniref:Acetyltransferase (GNAT) family protein n=2 Tax=Hydrogenoanaerobacterium saccharovorans TaxID=474960 RepID=A0A1H8ACC0_9FIRM|nr:acetyltransferase (GNAT) family protein [Hydrogenoanaerobacterium saccharovorans]SEM68370.1 Acetyltransferase (GNAT) family protein [Hydrogenoanaerobacterium saccharovorans]
MALQFDIENKEKKIMNMICKQMDYTSFPLLKPLWVKLVENNGSNSTYFSHLFKTFTFEVHESLLQQKIASGCEVIFFVLLSKEGGEPGGFCAVNCNRELGEGEIEMLYVDERLRGSGYGKLLMSKALAYFDENGISNLKLCVAFGNDKAIGFYQKFGFYPFTIDMLRK